MPGKWGLHTFYMRDSVIRSYLPHTRLFKRSSLKKMLRKYKTVYIKPNMSHMGKGIIKAWKSNNGYRVVKVKGTAQLYRSRKKLYKDIHKDTKSDTFIIQRAIDLAAIKGRPFDIRVMMMRDPENKWKYMGMLAKVAGRSSVITNVNRGGGYVIPVDKALSGSLSLSKRKKKRLTRKLKDLSYRISRRFIRYKYSSQIGIDFAVDKKKNIWVIEVNFDYPSHGLFAKLKDRSHFLKIKAIRLSYLKALRAGKIKRN